ncbi:MAG: recombinase RecT [Pseudomonadota bacterium]
MNAESKAVTQPARQDLRSLLSSEAMKKQLAMALPKVLPLDRFLRVLFTTMQRDPKLAECERESVLAGIMTAASLGLEIDPALGRFYLIPFNDRKRGMIAQPIIGYKGYIDLFYRSGQAAGLIAEAVYEKDHFVYQLGLEPKCEHIPSDDLERGKLKYAYCVATLSNGGQVWKVLNRAQVMAAKAYSRGSDSPYSPWNTNEAEMWVKTAIRALADRMPLSAELRTAVSAESGHDQAAYASAIDVPATTVATEVVTVEAPADPMQSLTPRQRVNTLILQCGQNGLSDGAQTLITKHGGDLQKLDDQALKILGEDLANLIRASLEG